MHRAAFFVTSRALVTWAAAVDYEPRIPSGQTGNKCDNRNSKWLFWRSDMAELARTALTLSTWNNFGVTLG